MRRRNSFRRRKSFLIDSNLAPPKPNKRVRNAFLNGLRKVFLLSVITKWFKGQVIVSVVLFGMACFIAFSLFSPYFKLKQISVVRNNPNIDVEAIQTQLEGFYGENTLFLPKDSMKATLLEGFPEFQSISITEEWPDGISLEVELAPPLYILLNRYNAAFFVLTETGVVLPKTQDESLPVLDILQYEKALTLRDQFLSSSDVAFIEAAREFVTKEIGQEVIVMKYLWAAQELHLVIEQDTELWFDLRVDLKDQTSRLMWGLDEINFYSRPPKHVDLRIPSQLYWAPR